MKNIIIVILILINTNILSQTISDKVKNNFSDEFKTSVNRFSIVDRNNISQSTINKLFIKKLRKFHITNNPLTLFASTTQAFDSTASKAAMHHSLYQAKIKRLTHSERDVRFKTFFNRYEFYSNHESNFTLSNGEICTTFNTGGKITYNKLVNKILKSYINSNSHKQILLLNNDKGEGLGTYVVIKKNGSVYNTVVFP